MDTERYWTAWRGLLLAGLVSLPGPTRAADSSPTSDRVIRILCRLGDENVSAILMAETATEHSPPLRVVCTAVDPDGRDITLSEDDAALLFCGQRIYMNGTELQPTDQSCRESVLNSQASEVSPGVVAGGEDKPGTSPEGW